MFYTLVRNGCLKHLLEDIKMTGQELNQQRYDDLVALSEKMKLMYEYQSKKEGIDPQLVEYNNGLVN